MILPKAKRFLHGKDEKNYPFWLYGLVPEAKAYGVFLLWQKLSSPLLYLTVNDSRAEDIYRDLLTFCGKENVFFLPFKKENSSIPRYQILYQLQKKNKILLVIPLPTLLQKVPSIDLIERNNLRLKRGEDISRDNLLRNLSQRGYEFSSLVEEKGDYSVRGGIIDFYSPLYSNPIRVELLDEKIESIREFDSSNQLSIRKREEVTISSRDEFFLAKKEKGEFSYFIKALPQSYFLIVDEPFEAEAKKLLNQELISLLLQRPHFYLSTLPQKTFWMKPKETFSVSSSSLSSYRGNLDLLVKDIRKWEKKDYQVTILTSTSGQAQRLQEIISEKGVQIYLKKEFSLLNEISSPVISTGDIQKGFILRETKDVFISDEDIFRRYQERRKRWPLQPRSRVIQKWTELQEDDYVVHIDHGIGIFKGITTLEMEGEKCDYFQINYKGSDKLYVPPNQLDRLHKYVGDSDNPPPIYTLEGGRWEWTKRRVKEATQELASSLLKLYSLRKVVCGYSFSSDTVWQLEFEASFPYQETSDQLKATEQVKKDMENSFPMDRLICGDAGYGKTEVAIRASFKVLMDNKQTAVLVPTTILAEQHYRVFKERMAAYPVNIEMLSRFQSPRKQREIIGDLKRGKVDIIIGTHRLIQDDINFKDLGLVVIDEEQRFGVRQKKKLREVRNTVDVLALSATPIPRSFYMSLTGIRQLSTILSPPEERLNVETQVAEYNEELIKKAIEVELERGGQVFYLYNRVKEINQIAAKVNKIIPGASIAISHGQLSPKELEKTMRDFLQGKYGILVCTSIIESGIDMPNVNTLIVERAEQFGLADLYQLRGRVGRGKRKGYAYFFFTPAKLLTEKAKKRLQIINQFKGFGAGFRIAMEDLQIRGAGNLLGKEQHGHMAAVGFTLYSQLLSQEIKKLKGEKVKPSFTINLDLGVEARIPSSYVAYPEQRLGIYLKTGEIKNEKDLLKFKEELRDRYGPLPYAARNLIHLLEIKLLSQDLGITSLRRKNSKIWVSFFHSFPLTEKKKAKMRKNLIGIQALPLDSKNLILESKGKGKEFLVNLKKILQNMKDMI